MIIFKLIPILVFLLFAYVVIRIAVRLWKESNEADVKEKMNDIKNDASLNDDVETFTKGNKETITKSKSSVVKEFLDT